MREIHVFFDNTYYTFAWLQPLFEAKKYFKKLGYHINFSRLDIVNIFLKKSLISQLKKEKSYDIVVLAIHHKSELGRIGTDQRRLILENIKEKCNKLVWMDCSDSTGTCMFDVLDVVDLYLKKQILKDKHLYTNQFKGQRIHTDYYYKTFHLSAPSNETEVFWIADVTNLSKIDVSWNISFWNNIRTGMISRIKKLLSLDSLNLKGRYTDFEEKNITLFFNGTCPKEENAISFQRLKVFSEVEQYNDSKYIVERNKISRKSYELNMRSSKFVISPFGWGEICNRDFEAFLFGSCLIKPTVNHLETFPNLFIENETYIPIDWDFQNFKKILYFLSTAEGQSLGKNIAKKGNDLFVYYRKNKGSLLAEHIVDVFSKHNI
ncbi:MAG: hypothetical protein ACOX0I_01925 [Bacilli bacterium]|jgi:hypothetical protein